MAQSKSPPKACATSANTKFLRALHALCALHALLALHALCAQHVLHALLAYIALQKTGSKCVHKQKKQSGLKLEEEKKLQWSFANCLSLRKTVKNKMEFGRMTCYVVTLTMFKFSISILCNKS